LTKVEPGVWGRKQRGVGHAGRGEGGWGGLDSLAAMVMLSAAAAAAAGEDHPPTKVREGRLLVCSNSDCGYVCVWGGGLTAWLQGGAVKGCLTIVDQGGYM
jgi:hypothetical protein